MGHKPTKGGILFFAFVVLIASASSALAYDRYSQNRDATNCAACHGDFNSGSYVSLHDGTAWGTDLMAGHNAMMSNDCSACHQTSSRFPVLTNSSAGGSKGFSTSGCIGCHGRQADAGHGTSDGRGVGLRQHHDRKGITLCRGCHADANTASPTYTPVAESSNPFNYFSPDTNHPSKPTDACDANGTESYVGSAGLDNDGNGLYDAADPACRPATTTTTSLSATTTTMPLATTTTTAATTTTVIPPSTTTTMPSSTTTTALPTTTSLVVTTSLAATTSTTVAEADADHDGVPDAVDPCLNAGVRDMAKSKLVLKRLDEVAGDDGLLVKGEFVAASPFANLDPQRLRVIGVRSDGSTAFDIPIAGEVSVTTKKILFKDDAGANNGITKLLVIDRSKKAPNQVKVLVKGKDGSYPVKPGDEPLRVVVVVGDGSAGDCGEARFGTGACTFNGSATKMTCR